MEGERPCLSESQTWSRLQLSLNRPPKNLSARTRNTDSSTKQSYCYKPTESRPVTLWAGVHSYRVKDRQGKTWSARHPIPTRVKPSQGVAGSYGRPLRHYAQRRAKMLFMMCLCWLLNTSVAEVTMDCPQDCVCPSYVNMPTIQTSLTSAHLFQDTGAFAAINCSNLDLSQYTLYLNAPSGYDLPKNTTTKDDTDSGVAMLTKLLQCLDLSHNNLVSAKPNLSREEVFLENVTLGIQVEALNLSHNNIASIMAADLDDFSGVRSLDLSYNHLSWIDGDAFLHLKTLVILNLSHNDIEDVGNNTFVSLVNLQSLDLSYNNVQITIIGMLQALSSLQYLYLNNNNLHPVTSYTTTVFPPLPKLLMLDMSHTQLMEVPDNMSQSLSSLTILNMVNCSLRELGGQSLGGLQSLEELRLDQNDISVIDKPAFQNTSLRILSLASMPSLGNISHDAFLGLDHLTYLNLSHNPELSFIQPNLFVPLDNLQILDLSNSSITQLSEITFHRNKELERIFLQHNPLSCSCINAWLAETALQNQTKFVDVSSLQCFPQDGQPVPISQGDYNCGEVQIHNTTSKLVIKLGSQLLLKCQYEMEEPAVLTWTTPRGHVFYHHHFHPDASLHLLSPKDIQPDSEFHKGHYWHDTSSYHSELSSYKDRVVILTDGSLYIDYMLRTDTGPYECQVSNAQYNHSTTISLFVDCKLSTEVKICAIVVGLLCALAFFTLNVIYVIISWIARRLVNKRRREIIRQMLENLNTYKSAQITRIHENYTYQLGRVRNQYHYQRDRLHRNYTSQVDKMKRGCSNQVERVRDNYNSKLAQLRDYSSNQIVQIRERANNQIVRIRDYGSNQLDKLRETYKLQQQHVLKLLDTMNLDNCRNVVETECMRTESMMYDIDLLGDDERTDSPTSQEESEYGTAASSPVSSMEEGTLGQDMIQHERRELSDDSSENNIMLEMQTTIDMEGGLSVDVSDTWCYRERGHASSVDDDRHHRYKMNMRSNDGHVDESLLQLQSDPLLFDNSPRAMKSGAALPTLSLRVERGAAKASNESQRGQRSDSESNCDGVYMTPEASPTKVWHGRKSKNGFEQADESYYGSPSFPGLYFGDDEDSLSSETIV